MIACICAIYAIRRRYCRRALGRPQLLQNLARDTPVGHGVPGVAALRRERRAARVVTMPAAALAANGSIRSFAKAVNAAVPASAVVVLPRAVGGRQAVGGALKVTRVRRSTSVGEHHRVAHLVRTKSAVHLDKKLGEHVVAREEAAARVGVLCTLLHELHSRKVEADIAGRVASVLVRQIGDVAWRDTVQQDLLCRSSVVCRVEVALATAKGEAYRVSVAALRADLAGAGRWGGRCRRRDSSERKAAREHNSCRSCGGWLLVSPAAGNQVRERRPPASTCWQTHAGGSHSLFAPARARARPHRPAPRGEDPMCLSRLGCSTQVVTESAAVLFDTESAWRWRCYCPGDLWIPDT